MTFKFIPGEYTTRDGRRAVVLSDQYTMSCGEALTGVVESKSDPGRWLRREWFDNGSYSLSGENDVDLMPPCQERWVNVYPTDVIWSVARWNTRQIADREQMELDRIAVLHLTFSADGKTLISCEVKK